MSSTIRSPLLFLLPFLLLPLLSPLLAQPTDPGYALVWEENFSYPDHSQPSSTIWNWDTGGGGWGNNELEYYTTVSSNSYVYNDTLVIAGLYQSMDGSPFTSARLTTTGKVMFYHGYVAARAMINMNNGFWPAIWAMGNKTVVWPQCGEIDFMEQVNGQDATPPDNAYTQFGTLHYNVGGEDNTAYSPTQAGGTTQSTSPWGASWHVYAFEWTSSSIAFSVDSNVYFSADLSSSVDFNSFTDPTNPFYFLVNLAFGGEFPNMTPVQQSFPAYLYVDWIKVWQVDDGVSYIVAPNPVHPGNLPGDGSSTAGASSSGEGSSGSSASSAIGTSSVGSSSSSGRGSASGSARGSGVSWPTWLVLCVASLSFLLLPV